MLVNLEMLRPKMIQQCANSSGAETVPVPGKDTKGKTSKRISGLKYSQMSWRHQAGTQRRAQKWVRICYMVNYTSCADGEGQSLGLREGEKKGIWGGIKKKKVGRGDPNSNLLVWLIPFKALPGRIMAVAG